MVATVSLTRSHQEGRDRLRARQVIAAEDVHSRDLVKASGIVEYRYRSDRTGRSAFVLSPFKQGWLRSSLPSRRLRDFALAGGATPVTHLACPQIRVRC